MKTNLFLLLIVLFLISNTNINAQKTQPSKKDKKSTPSSVEEDGRYALKINDVIYNQYVDTIPARIELYDVGHEKYIYLRPIDLNTYEYLSYYPLTAFLFAVQMDENKISNLSVKDLKSLCFGGCSFDQSKVRSLFHIKGFEEYAKEISKSDEFAIYEKQNIYISKLLECYRNYEDEFENRYLNTTMSLYGGTEYIPYKEFNENVKCYGKEAERTSILPLFINLKKEKYNFENQTYPIDLPFFEYNYRIGWDYNENLKNTYHVYRGNDRINLYIPVSYFKNYIDNYYNGLYIFTVRPTRNIMSTLYGDTYNVSLLDFIALDVIITFGYMRYNSEEFWVSQANEYYRINIFSNDR